MLPGALTPTLQAHLSRLGSRLSFAEAASELGYLKGVRVAASTARRRTEADGALYAAEQDADAAWVLATAPLPPPGPATQQVSVDGAMVPLADGSWREVRTLAIGTVVPGRPPGTVRCEELSYFSRLTDAATFIALASGEVYRRGVETAQRVALVVDGAEWEQAFADAHCPGAVRMLDFGHGAQRLSAVAAAVWGSGPSAETWAAAQRAELRDGTPEAVIAAIRALPVTDAPDATVAARVQDEVLGYLEPRLAQMRYAVFRAEGLPIGSGIVESANKTVVEARLKGAGRRWAERHVTPMVAMRGALYSDRWAEAWAIIAAARGPRARRAPTTRPAAVTSSAPSAASVAAPVPPSRVPSSPTIPRSGPKTIIDGRPTGAHPWKRGLPRRPSAPAKL